jgi:hypothetical protein
MTPKTADLLQDIKRIRQAVESYKCNDADKEALARIARSERALEALAQLRLTDGKLNRLIVSFVGALSLKRNFKELLASEIAVQKHTGKLREAVKILREFVKEISAPPTDPLRAWINVSDDERRTYLRALYMIDVLIENRDRIARETPNRIGATRKSTINKAGENAAIGWIASSIKRIANKPNYQQARILAEVLLRLPEIDEDRFRKRLRISVAVNRRLA